MPITFSPPKPPPRNAMTLHPDLGFERPDSLRKRLLAKSKERTFPCPPYPPRPQGPSDCPCGLIGPHSHKVIHGPLSESCWVLTGPVERLAQARVSAFVAYGAGQRISGAPTHPKGAVRTSYNSCSDRCVNPAHLTDNPLPGNDLRQFLGIFPI